MEILVCDYCYEDGKGYVDATTPVLIKMGRREFQKAACEACAERVIGGTPTSKPRLAGNGYSEASPAGTMTTTEVAEAIGLSKSALFYYVSKGDLRIVGKGPRRMSLFDAKEAKAFIRSFNG